MGRFFLVIGAAAVTVAAAVGQTPPPAQDPRRMEITLERNEGSNWHAVDPRLVLQQGDRVRFRVRTNFDGYLYVMNQSSSGRYTLLFPSEDSGQKNQIEGGRDHLVPALQGSFRITGPPGHETVYWLVSPVELAEGGGAKPDYVPLPPPPKDRNTPPNITPRCDDTVFRARGDCVDTSAGPKPVPEAERLPENLADVPRTASRELLFIREQNGSVVSAPATAKGPVIFTFRLAHR